MDRKLFLCFVCLVCCTWARLMASEENLDLKSVLLQILNKVKTDGKAATLTGVKLATSSEVESPNQQNQIPEQISNNNDATDEPYNGLADIVKEATEKISTEIARLKAKYINELGKIGYNVDADNKDFGNNIDVDETSEGIQQPEYAASVREMNNAVETLLLLRVKLETEYGISEDEIQLAYDPKTISKTQEVNQPQGKSTTYRLMKILNDIELYRDKGQGNEPEMKQIEDELKLAILDDLKEGSQNVTAKNGFSGNMLNQDQIMGGDLMKTKLTQRNWHSKNCRKFGAKCGGWFPMCCGLGFIDTKQIHMCCSVVNSGFKKTGMCVPNPFGSRPCHT